MPRARISKNGIELAMAGYDVNTAPIGKMLLSPNFSTMRVALTGTVTVAPYSGAGSDAHDMARVSFGFSFGQAPLVYAAGILNGSTADISPFIYQYTGGSGAVWIDCHYSIHTYPTYFDLYVMKSGLPNKAVIPRTWKYFVFANTMG